MKPYQFAAVRVFEILKTPKCLEEGEDLEFTKHYDTETLAAKLDEAAETKS
jgi:hypothetical protein